MSGSVIDYLTRGTFTFLRPEPAEIRRVIPRAETLLPTPVPIFLREESATPLFGFPVLRDSHLEALDGALDTYLDAERDAQVAYRTRQSFDSRAYAKSWEHYLARLARVMENSIHARHGGNYAGVFWLEHSSAVARRIHEVPSRLRRTDPGLGREHGDAIKYGVFSKWIDRVVTSTYDVAQRLAPELQEDEDALFPGLLALMRDNVLIFTEDYISPDLGELGSYFRGCLKIDGRDLRQSLAALERWLQDALGRDRLLHSAVVHLLAEDARVDARRLLARPGFVSFLANLPGYDAKRFLNPDQIPIWESLLDKIKEYEILVALRKMIIRLEPRDGALVCRERSGSALDGDRPEREISPATRPIDFGTSWVVDPVVQRFGLIYDITDFSATLSILGRAEKMALDEAFRMTSSFQRKIDKLASSLGLRLEKYLGDGAFYSGRHPRRMLVVAIHLQRTYPRFLEQGFPFRSGLRIAMNYGEYRLMPLEGTYANGQVRYEFFGHGLVELSRLSTGKKTQQIEELKTYLISQGYPETAVNKFFTPMMQRSSELVSKLEQARSFYAYINQNGTLINEGIVATEPFMKSLGAFSEMAFARDAGRGFIAVPLEDAGGKLWIGARKLGVGKFKGLEPMPVYEIIDGAGWRDADRKAIPSQDLIGAMERLFASARVPARRARG